MTCIVAVVQRGRVVMGADSMVTDDGGSALIMRRPKLELVGQALVGWAGTVAHAQAALRFMRANAPRSRNMRDGSLADGLRGHFKRAGLDNSMGMLIAAGGSLWDVDSSFAFSELEGDYAAIGSGADVARGVLFATDAGSSLTPLKRVHLALMGAQRHGVGVREPWQIAHAPCRPRVGR